MNRFSVSHYSAPSLTRVPIQNQDGYCISAFALSSAKQTEHWLFAVADGMSTLDNPSFASGLALEAAMIEYVSSASESADALCHKLVSTANNALLRQQPRLNLGTTLTFAIVQGQIATVGHVGDTRAYHMRSGHCSCLTKDHSKLARALGNRNPTAKEVKDTPKAKKLLLSLGERQLNADEVCVNTIELATGDIIALCSDGIWTEFEDEELADAIGLSVDPTSAKRIVQLAMNKDPSDDATLLLFQCL